MSDYMKGYWAACDCSARLGGIDTDFVQCWAVTADGLIRALGEPHLYTTPDERQAALAAVEADGWASGLPRWERGVLPARTTDADAEIEKGG